MSDYTQPRSLQILQALLLSGDCYHALDTNRETVFAIVPELRDMVGFAQVHPYHCRDLWDHTIFSVSQILPDFSLRITMLLHDIGKLSTKSTDRNGLDHFYGHPEKSVALGGMILDRLGIEEKDCLLILKLIALHDTPLPKQAAELHNWIYKYGTDFLLKLLQVKRADVLAQSPDKLLSRISELEETRRLIVALPDFAPENNKNKKIDFFQKKA